MEVLTLSSQAIGVIAAAFIAGLTSLIVTILAKDQKVSEFRQAWINDLRDDAAELVSHLSITSLILRYQDGLRIQGKDVPQINAGEYKDFVTVQACILRIRLRLNEKDHADLLKALKKFDYGPEGTLHHHAQTLNAFTDEVRKVISNEWIAVKKGEPWVRAIKLSATVVVGVSVLALAWKLSGG
ncbi:hypothetical protein RRX38_02660 [Pseudomonas sp. DTU_2021_1001937_2_SI_NGA_ILE_001]|uniref:hypothetical protein n=1 Tax=Pseudomonas sp. DTU_2021_1001937_2_SI_NGA_ILE_001 TaxID=3077589 RepID=UPI0028FC2197|nr:hypothetical protein [Pseudomonas sp. DTU_2021_1001937_2_SI_NGA_ILE_001]WNW10093.1 hypothetical protein RRX38_02660 [Pseudomonas sp. DTU_2021_1001937_2_SI_NGA_ILE_001]